MGLATAAGVVPWLAAAVAASLATGCSPAPSGEAGAGQGGGTAVSSPPIGDGATPVPPASGGTTVPPASGGTPADASLPAVADDAPPPDPVVAADRLAGVLARDVPQAGDGKLTVVPGSSQAPHDGRVRRIRVAVEGGLPVDGAAFADVVLATLNDGRSWAHDGYAFARTDGDADTEVVLASPDLSAELCRPLRTMGSLSCRNGDRVVITWYRWVNGQEDFGADPAGLTTYRQYVVNHEVGHSLGHGHVGCPGPGELAPVMMQQTKGVKPCVANAWPYP